MPPERCSCGGSCRQTSEGRKRMFYVGEVGLNEQATSQRLEGRLAKQIRRGACASAVAEGSSGRGRGDGPEPRSLLLGNVRVVEHDALGNAEAPPAPLGWKREMDQGGQHVGEAVERQRGLVREDA